MELTQEGYIKVNADMSTNIKGVYAAGDITSSFNNFKQIITAAAGGAVAANAMFKYIKGGRS